MTKELKKVVNLIPFQYQITFFEILTSLDKAKWNQLKKQIDENFELIEKYQQLNKEASSLKNNIIKKIRDINL